MSWRSAHATPQASAEKRLARDEHANHMHTSHELQDASGVTQHYIDGTGQEEEARRKHKYAFNNTVHCANPKPQE
jgi:hypothetical protein